MSKLASDGQPAASPRGRFGTVEGYAQQAHELNAGLAEDQFSIDLCEPGGTPDESALDDSDKFALHVLRLNHDEALRHGAICDGIHVVEDDEGDEDEGEGD